MQRRELINFIATTALFALTPFKLAAKSNEKILVLIELQGANDGLNTVIPIKDKTFFVINPGAALDGL